MESGVSYGRLLDGAIHWRSRMGAGVVTFVNGRVFGGDSGYMYVGTYTRQGNTVTANVHVKPHVPGSLNVMGRSEFDLQLSGMVNGDAANLTGTIPGTPLKLQGTLTKQHDIDEAT